MVRLVLVLAAALALGGCSRIHNAAKIDPAAGERLIRRAVTEQIRARVASVTCPKGLTAKKGRTFRCRVAGVDGTAGDALVIEKNDRGKVAIDAPFLHVREVERSIGSGIKQQIGSDVRVRCPEIVVVKAGDRFTCTAASGSRRTRVRVVQQDANGRVRYTLAG